MFERGSTGAALTFISLVTLGCALVTWYRGRIHDLPMRWWHGAVLGLIVGVLVVVDAESV